LANELQLSAVTGIANVIATLYNGNVQVGGTISMTEIGTTGEYIGSIPNNTPTNHYLVLFTSNDIKLASGEMYWDGKYEFIESLTTIQGLVPGRPSTTTQTTWDAGTIHIDITGDQTTTTTMTRN
jgi:hypothetical protein